MRYDNNNNKLSDLIIHRDAGVQGTGVQMVNVCISAKTRGMLDVFKCDGDFRLQVSQGVRQLTYTNNAFHG